MDNVLEVRNLKTYIYASAGLVRAVDGIGFDIRRGEVFGLVGESGSGKTMTALSVLRLIAPPARIISGRILFAGTDLVGMGEKDLRKIRGAKISIVFQEPASAFNPIFTAGYQIMESIMVHQALNRSESKALALQYLTKVRMAEPERIYHSYPHQLSGGTKQRTMMAMALVNSPELLILDEPTTALDVTIQTQILDLIKEIIASDKMSVLFISHDLGVIAKMCSRVAVMHEGKIVEQGTIDEVLSRPRDKYTIELIESVKALG